MIRIILIILAIVLGIIAIVLNNESGQLFLLDRGVKLAMAQEYEHGDDSLRVLVCGSSSPLPAVGRAQGCIAIITPEHFFVIDSGAASTVNLQSANLPLNKLDGVLVTHFHSDHIAELYEINLVSWVGGRPEPMKVYGPKGIKKVISGINDTYELDVQYRTEHHGSEFMPAKLAELQPVRLDAGEVLTIGSLKITSFSADHSPISPAVSYKIEYKDRVVVVTGDTNVTTTLAEQVKGIDLLLTDALSLPILDSMIAGATEAGRSRAAKILTDVRDYHASTDKLLEMIEENDVQMIGFYHMVPAPSNIVMEKIYKNDLPTNVVLTDDGMWFTLPVGSDQVQVD
ncbi:MAG: ribonuclease Z [Candidatus Azotimanducaceae bacterium]